MPGPGTLLAASRMLGRMRKAMRTTTTDMKIKLISHNADNSNTTHLELKQIVVVDYLVYHFHQTLYNLKLNMKGFVESFIFLLTCSVCLSFAPSIHSKNNIGRTLLHALKKTDEVEAVEIFKTSFAKRRKNTGELIFV